MKIYRLESNLNVYQTLVPAAPGAVERYRAFNGEPLAASLDDFPVQIPEEEKARPAGDFPGLTSHIPVFGPRSAGALGDLLARAGELFPLHCENCPDEYLAMNVLTLVQALDEEHARVKRYASSDRIMRIIQYAFLKDKLPPLEPTRGGNRLGGTAIFKIPQTALQETYVTREFVHRVIGSDLRGFVFETIWTDEDFVILCPYCLGLVDEATENCPTCGLDTTRDAPLEMTLEEARGMKRVPCAYCGTRIREWADPCPYCKRGQQRDGQGTGVAVV